MNNPTESLGERIADFTLPEGCLLCGGELAVRATPSGAHTYCGHCHWISHPHMRMSRHGLELAYSTKAAA